MIRIKAKNPRRTHEYYCEPCTVQHFLDGLWLTLTAIPRFAFRRLTSKNAYNRTTFGVFPANQMQPLRDVPKSVQ